MSAATMMTALSYAGRENAYAQTGSDYKALVCLFLEGGNDGWNTMVPLGSPHNIYTLQPAGIGSCAGQSLTTHFAGAAPGQFGFHPSLAGLRTLFNQGRLAVVNNVGNLIQPVTPAQVLANPTLGAVRSLRPFSAAGLTRRVSLPTRTLGWGN